MTTKTPAPAYVPHRVSREGDLDIEFDGALLATSRYSVDGDRWTECDLFRTKGGHFVIATRFGSDSRSSMRRIASVCDRPEEVVEALRNRDGGLGQAAKEVLRKAYASHPDLFPLAPVERIA
jgi:hypothetical protein